MDLKKIEENICKSGFKLEHEIATILRHEGWTLISNRYYLDDHEESVREIDILAYKCKVTPNFSVYTAIIISCKKSEANNWAVLSRAIDKNDPNYNWQPFKGFSSVKSIQYHLNNPEWAELYYRRLIPKCPSIFSLPKVDIFAFQEMSKNSSTCQNDKNIFNSITSLMKAQAYELNSLSARSKNHKVVHQFNLISVIDSDLVRVNFHDGKVTASSIESEDYISKYILNKKDSISRIKFVTAKKFLDTIKPYSTLHSENVSFFEELNSSFYQDILQARDRSRLLIPEFRLAVQKYLWSPYYSLTREPLKPENFDISWSKTTAEAIIEVDATAEIVAALNDDDASIRGAKKILSEVYRYNGDVFFEDSIIF
ncbi:hypothetical protein AAGV37_19785 [Pseudomonas protegens]|uniref:hypothetical protein n=1 Tax=Pseudomonas protegens TaxID=380021 RepID=UPI00315872FF